MASHTMCMLVGAGDKSVVGATHSVLDVLSDNKQQWTVDLRLIKYSIGTSSDKSLMLKMK